MVGSEAKYSRSDGKILFHSQLSRARTRAAEASHAPRESTMLLRTSRRQIQPQIVRAALSEAQSLQLPFLCPSLLKPPVQRRRATTRAESSPETRPAPPKSGTSQSHAGTLTKYRGLASAAADTVRPQADYIPFDTPPDKTLSGLSLFGPDTIPPLHGFDLNPSPLVLNDAPPTSSGKFQAVNGISGTLAEIHQTLHASLQVGRFGRAAVLLGRLHAIYKSGHPGMLAANSEYLREMTLNVIRTKDMKCLDQLLDWFHPIYLNGNLPLDATTFALIIQACLQDENQERRAQEVEKYYSIARNLELESATRELVPDLEAAFKVSLSQTESRIILNYLAERELVC